MPAEKLGKIISLFFVQGTLKYMNFGLTFPHWNNMRFRKNVDLVYFAQLSFWQLLICVSWHLREMHYCGPNLFWDGCNEIRILGPQIIDYFPSSLSIPSADFRSVSRGPWNPIVILQHPKSYSWIFHLAGPYPRLSEVNGTSKWTFFDLGTLTCDLWPLTYKLDLHILPLDLTVQNIFIYSWRQKVSHLFCELDPLTNSLFLTPEGVY